MEISEACIIEIWNLFCDYVPPAKRNDLAVRFLKIFLDEDIDIDDLEEIQGEDENLDFALDHLDEDDDEEEDTEYEE